MLQKVPYETIDMAVVRDWCYTMEEKAEERGQALWSVRPFAPYDHTYMQISDEIMKKTPAGLDFYRKIVKSMPKYEFEKKLD